MKVTAVIDVSAHAIRQAALGIYTQSSFNLRYNSDQVNAIIILPLEMRKLLRPYKLGRGSEIPSDSTE